MDSEILSPYQLTLLNQHKFQNQLILSSKQGKNVTEVRK